MSIEARADAYVDDREWARLVEQIQNGDCTPFLGAGACSGTLPTGGELSRIWADEYKYPLGEEADLPEIMQYVTVIEQDPVTVKQRLISQLESYGQPDFSVPAQPHALLARFPISVYLTTNYDDFMAEALRRAGKQPTTTISPWYRGARGRPETRLPPHYEPDADTPLVYHLHGHVRLPPSLVLAEQDYVEFLINLPMDRAMDHPALPTEVRLALTEHPMLFIGYSLRDWSFRTLFHGLTLTVSPVQRRRHVSVQLAPLGPEYDEDARRRAEDFLTQQFDRLNISVYWGTADEFCTELLGRLESE